MILVTTDFLDWNCSYTTISLEVISITFILSDFWHFWPYESCFVHFWAEKDGEMWWKRSFIKESHQPMSVLIFIYEELVDFFEIWIETRQGCVLSSIIFNYVVDWIMAITCRRSSGVQINTEHSVQTLNKLMM